MSENVIDGQVIEEPRILLTIGDVTYDIAVIAKAIGYARDMAIAQDINNAAKNMADARFSPLTTALDEASDLLKEIFTVHGQPEQNNAEPADPAASS